MRSIRKFSERIPLWTSLVPLLAAFATSCASQQVGILQMIASAKTPADHESIAEYYDRDATGADESAQLHEAMAQRYREMRIHPRSETAEHCVRRQMNDYETQR